MSADYPHPGRPVRPPTILGEYGEGYCRICHMIEPLTSTGVLASHFRGFSSTCDVPDLRCKGSFKAPPKLTPFTSRLAAFRRTPLQGRCEVCREMQPLTPSSSRSVALLARHFAPDQPNYLCAGVGRLPVEDVRPVSLRHEGERG